MDKIKSYLKKIDYYKLSWFVFLITEFLCLLLFERRMNFYLDSDMSSEMILAKILLEEKKFITTSWAYSNDIRALHMHIVFAFYFLFFNDWHLVRFLTTVTLHLINYLSLYYMCKKLDIKRLFPSLAFAMLLAFTYYYFYIIIASACYVPYLFIIFLTVGWLISYGEKKNYLILFMSLLLAFLCGLNGIRQMTITYVPLSMAIGLIGIVDVYKNGFKSYFSSERFSQLIFMFLNCIANGLGYLVNSQIFTKIYYFEKWGHLDLVGFHTDSLKIFFTNIRDTMGYISEGLSLEMLFSNFVFVVLTIMVLFFLYNTIFKTRSYKAQLIGLYLSSVVFIFMCIYSFTSMGIVIWHCFPIIVLMFILSAVGFGYLDIQKKNKIAIIVALLFMMSVRSLFAYREIVKRDTNKDLIQIAEFVNKEGYRVGYASFFNSNIICELTNGNVDMYSWLGTGDGSVFAQVKDVDNVLPWLQKMSHLEQKPQGKLFIAFDDREIPYCNWKDKLDDQHIILKTDEYTVYGYNSYEEMRSIYDR